MANNPIKASDLYQDDGAIERAIKQLQQLAGEHEKVLAGVKKEAISLQVGVKKLNAATSEQREEISRYAKQADELEKRYQKYNDSLTEKVAPDTLAARDATVSTESGLLTTPAAKLATVISWEVFFGHRARSGVAAGGELLYNPTNGATYTGTLVQTQQVASTRLRAIETGRWAVQVSPTGFSAFVSPDGEVFQRSAQVHARVEVRRDIPLRHGETLYVRWGDLPSRLLALALMAVGWAFHLQSRRSPTHHPEPDQ